MQTYKADDALGIGESILVKREKADRDKNLHTHEFIEIIFISSGSGTEAIDGVEYAVSRGDMLFINFEQTHAFSKSDMEFVHILMRPEFMSEELVNSENIFDVFSLARFSTITGDYRQQRIVTFFGEERTRVSQIIETMLLEYDRRAPGYKTLLHGYMQVIFTMLIRKLKENEGYKRDDAASIARYVEEHLTERITLTDIAGNCFYNPSYFSRKFKSIFGKNLSGYVRERRLERAAAILRDEDSSVMDVAALSGFSDKTQFYKLFKERYGCTPGEYKKSKNQIP